MIRLPAATCRHSMVSPSLFAPLLVLGPQLLSAHVVRNGKHGGFFHPTGSHGKLGSMEFHGVPWGSRSNSQFVCGSLWQFYNVQVFRWKIMDLLNAEFCENSGTYGPLKECHKLSTHQKSSIFGGFFRFDPFRPSWPHVSPGSCGSLLRNPGAWLTPSSPGIPLIPCRDETTGCVGSGWKLYMII